MPYSVKDWRDSPDSSTPISAAALEDMETRLSGYTNLRSPVLNVKLDYGAAGDDATDDTTAFQNALNAAATGGSPVRAVYVPPGKYRIGSLTIPAYVTLIGAGPGASILRQKAGVADNSFLLTQTTPSMTSICDLQIDGRRQGVNVGAISLQGDWCYVSNVFITQVTGDGVYTHNYSGNNIYGTQVWDCAGHGFNLGPDATVTNCQAGVCGKDGFYIQGNSQLSNCKAWYSGYYNSAVQSANITAGYGNGFHWVAAGTFQASAGLSAQDNAAAGFLFDGAYNVAVAGFIADSNNNRTSGTSHNIEFKNNAGGNSLTGGQSVDRGANAPNSPTSGLLIGGGCQDNVIQMNTAGLSGKKISSTTTSNIYRNEVVCDGSRGRSQGIPYAASVTVDPTLGNIIDIAPLTGNISIALPAYTTTDPITLLFQQDGTGGRTITWNGNILTAWQPDATANARSSITIRYDADVARWKPVAYFKGTP